VTDGERRGHDGAHGMPEDYSGLPGRDGPQQRRRVVGQDLGSVRAMGRARVAVAAVVYGQDAVPPLKLGYLPGPVIAVARPAVQQQDWPALPGVGVEDAGAVGHLVVGHDGSALTAGTNTGTASCCASCR